MNELNIRRNLNDDTRRQGICISGKVYSLHITKNKEFIITDNLDYTKIYAVCSLDFYNLIYEDQE